MAEDKKGKVGTCLGDKIADTGENASVSEEACERERENRDALCIECSESEGSSISSSITRKSGHRVGEWHLFKVHEFSGSSSRIS